MTVTPEQLAQVLVERRRQRRLVHEQHAAQCRERLPTLVVRLAREYHFTRAWLIGSLVVGTFGEHSDVDVVVEGLADDRIGAVWGALEDGLATPVDLLRIESLSDSFRARVLREGVLVYE